MSTKQHPILQNKSSETYAYYSGDFSDVRSWQWSSVFYQVAEVIRNPEIHSVLEFGGGRNVSKALIEHFGIKHLGVDVDDKRFIPDVCASIQEFETSETFDLVCAFQTLEHNPYEEFGEYLDKFKRFSNRYVYISLPYSGRWFSLHLNLNMWRFNLRRKWFYRFPRRKKKVRPLDQYRQRPDKYNPHWWEVGDQLSPLPAVRQVITARDLTIVEEFHNPLFPYHIFFLLEKNS